MNNEEMLARLVSQAAGAGGDLVTLRAIVEEASQIGAHRVLAHMGLDDANAQADLSELRELLRAWRDAKASAWRAVIDWAVRGALALTKAARTWALAHRRTYVTPDDVKALAVPVLAHRLILDPEAEFDGVTAEAVVGQVLLDVVPPSQQERADDRGQRENV